MKISTATSTTSGGGWVCCEAAQDLPDSNLISRYENQDTDSRRAISENYKAIEWTPLRVQVLDDLYTKGTLSMQCNRSSGERFPGDWEGMSASMILKPLKLRSKCG